MNTLKSIIVTVNDGVQDHTFEVDLDTNCSLFWNKEGWQVLEDYYVKVKPDPVKARQVRDRACPKAKPKSAALATTLAAPAPSGDAVIALKEPDCLPTGWP
jgi:hypothetical protein